PSQDGPAGPTGGSAAKGADPALAAAKAADPALAAAALARTLVPLLWTVAVLATLAAVAELLRYILLLFSRDDALPAAVVAASDAVTIGAGIATLIATAGAGLLLVLWSLRAQAGAAQRGGVRPSRSRREVVLGWLVPGVNLTLPGSVLAEIEHGLLERPPDTRPRPTRLVVLWWLLWDAGVVLCVVTLLWALRDGVQARADGVLLHALLDLVAATTAVATAVLVRQFTRLLHPAQPPRRMLLVRLGAAEPSPTAPATPA
ncbi:MAG: hypothetical protein JWR88_765, partial [Pseudonocardia sp.]|nr:hypothetical protein [Pseudonocardia sp.]